jgi:hypothetical protein
MNDKANELNLDAKLDMLDDQLNPIEDLKDEKTDKVEEVEEAVGTEDKDESDDSGDDNTESDESAAEEDSETEEATEEDGYTIDGDEEDPVDKPVDEIRGDTTGFNPEQKYIIDNLTPITVRGQVGEKVETFKVLDPSQLPQGFKFLDDRDQALAIKGFAMLETQAEKLQADFRGQETTKAATEFKKREDDADRTDIGALQRSGDLPRFKAEVGSKDFADDPGVKLVQEIIDFKETTNTRYMEEYNAGRPYKHIGFEEAFRMFKRENPQETAQAKEDAERGKIAKRSSRNKGTAEQPKDKARVHSGSSSRDLDNLIESLDW